MATNSNSSIAPQEVTIPVTVSFQLFPKFNQPIGDNNWVSLSVKGPDGKVFTASGKIPVEFKKVKLMGRKIQITGNFSTYSGKQVFNWTSVEIIRPNDKLAYLVDILKTGKGAATEMLSKFGDEVFTVIEKQSHRLLEIKGISQKKLEKIRKAHEMYQKTGALSRALANLDVSQNLKLRIGECLGDDAAALIAENPYRIVMTPRIASSMSFAKLTDFSWSCEVPEKFNDYVQRARAATIWATSAVADRTRSTVISGQDIIDECLGREAYENEDIQQDAVEGLVPDLNLNYIQAAIRAVKNEQIVEMKAGYASAYNYSLESEIFDYFTERRNNSKSTVINDAELAEYIEIKSREMNVEFSEEQASAVRLVASGETTICVGGYAGTGKSTVARAMLGLLDDPKRKKAGNPTKIICLAFSGVASDKINKASGYPAQTIHSALAWIPASDDEIGGFLHNRFNPLDYDVVLVDEASMIDAQLFHDLLAAIRPQTKLILLGDDAQLPPIGNGCVFCDILKSKLMPVIQLKKIWRQSEESVLTFFADKIRQGLVPDGYLNEGWSDFEFRQKQEPWEIIAEVLKLARDAKESIEDVVSDFQVLTPMNKNELGTRVLNLKLQNVLNPALTDDDPEIYGFRKNDKIIHNETADMEAISFQSFKNRVKNQKFEDMCPTKFRIRNGAIGVVEFVNKIGNKLYVKHVVNGIKMLVKYEKKQVAEKMSLAYALNVHKFQGSEAVRIVIPIHIGQRRMLEHHWLYTAITRAKEKCTMVGQSAAFDKACLTSDQSRRITVLQELIASDLANLAYLEKEKLAKAKPKKHNNKLGWTVPDAVGVAGGAI